MLPYGVLCNGRNALLVCEISTLRINFDLVRKEISMCSLLTKMEDFDEFQ